MDYKRVEGYLFTDEKNRQGIKKIIRDIHNKSPKYILLNDTSATAWGLVLKEAWKKAYPSEKPPKFYRIDPRSLENIPKSEKSRRAWKQYLERRGMKETDKIINFDEEYAGGSSVNKVREAFENESGLYGPHHFNNMDYLYCDAGWMVRDNGRLVRPRNPTNPERWVGHERYRISGGVMIDQGREHFRIAKKSKEPVLEPIKFTGDLVHHPSEEYKETYQEIKISGKEIGEELHAELEQEAQKKKSLEQRLSTIIAIGGLVSSFFFLGSSVTGNVIGNINRSSGIWWGIGLFFIGIAGALFYFRSKKR